MGIVFKITFKGKKQAKKNTFFSHPSTELPV